jgi:hypothetical protein
LKINLYKENIRLQKQNYQQFNQNKIIINKQQVMKKKNCRMSNLFTLGITSILHNSRETINGLSAIPMSMANIGGHLMSTLNASHLPNGTGQYFVSGK